jgi:hypothetical protein
MQGLQHEAIAAKRHDHIGFLGLDITVEFRQADKRGIGFYRP